MVVRGERVDTGMDGGREKDGATEAIVEGVVE